MTERRTPEPASAAPPRCTPPLADWPALAAGGPIRTGHQPRFWHPGVLAKYVAVDRALAATGDHHTPLPHVVVDQDVQDPLTLPVPVRDGDALRAVSVTLARTRPDVPTGRQPAADVPADVGPLLPRHADPRAAGGVRRVAAALREHRHEPTLARQVTAALAGLLRPFVARPLAATFATELQRAPWFAGELHHLLHDAERCVSAYNRAVAGDPGAGVAALVREPWRVELPLWSLVSDAPRRRVYADLADRRPLLTLEDGTPLGDDADLAPRALWMTALLRRDPAACGLFVHGTGGGRYDRITDRWWAAWRGEPLAPVAVATADARLAFPGVAVAEPADVTRAVWFAHHLPHNLDRHLKLTGARASEKHKLLRHMDDDRDPRRRRVAFARLQQLNAELAAAHPDALQRARAAAHAARRGVRHAAVARRRDWPFVYFSEVDAAKPAPPG